MFAKLKKKIAEEAATAPRSGGRIPRSISKESITSVGADSGDDFVSVPRSSIAPPLESSLQKKMFPFVVGFLVVNWVVLYCT